MFLSGDKLLVANSGGTNISLVDAAANPPFEIVGSRILTPQQQLFEVGEGVTENGLRYTRGTVYNFSDRPQFIAQDINGLILYSTKPTAAATPGTIRFVVPSGLSGGARAEPRLLLGPDSYEDATDNWAIAGADSVHVVSGASGDGAADDAIVIYDHLPGNPSAVDSIRGVLSDSLLAAFRARGSDVTGVRAKFNLAGIALQDTTYVAASGDRTRIIFGEGDIGPFGRIFLWNAATNPGSIESGLFSTAGTQDLINNAADRVLGVGLNSNGTMGVGRGAQQVYFFSNNVSQEGYLRLQGIYSDGVSGGNGGVALHPQHSQVLATGPTSVAFIATGNRTIKIVDTVHYCEKTEIAIRDNIVGQLRAAIPANPSPAVAVQLYGVTSDNSLVIVNIRAQDLQADCQ
jgi:hypothetical protein